MTVPQALFSPLNRADGSATFSHGGYSVLAAVNGPVEVQRRDELPEEAAIEVNVRPASGVGSPKERHLESILARVFKQIILTRRHPRTLVQITLQILSVPEDEDAFVRKSCHLSILPALLQAGCLALVDGCIPLAMTLTATSAVIRHDGEVVLSPSPKDVRAAESIHVLAFSSKADLLVAESEGDFDMDEWDKVEAAARMVCCKASAEDMDVDGMEGEGRNMSEFVLRATEEQVDRKKRWKTAG